ncbi:MAG: hypothetical protein AAF720_09465 [Pseudomonadota bacterium]
MHRLFIGLIVFLAISACTTIPEEPIAGGKQYALAVAMEDAFRVRKTGTTVFNNKETNDAALEFDIPAYISGKLVEGLEKRHLVTPIEVDVNGLLSTVEANSRKIFGGSLKVSALTKDFVVDKQPEGFDRNSFDGIILVYPSSGNTAGFRGEPNLSGIGLYRDSFFGLKTTVMYLGARVAILDPETLEPEVERQFTTGVLIANGKKQSCADCFYRDVNDGKLFQLDPTDYTDEQRQMLASHLREMIDQGALYTLYQLGLGPIPAHVAE